MLTNNPMIVIRFGAIVYGILNSKIVKEKFRMFIFSLVTVKLSFFCYYESEESFYFLFWAKSEIFELTFQLESSSRAEVQCPRANKICSCTCALPVS